ncbi:MAG: trigger factor [Patescibacteria group bacterium]
MNVTLTKKPKSLISLMIEVPWEEVQPYLTQAARAWSEEHPVPGFRKGQAPFDIIEKRLGREALLDMALEILVSHTYLKAVTEHKLDTIGQPQVEMRAKAWDLPVQYEAVVAVIPEVKLSPLEKISVARNKVSVSEEEIEKLLEELRRARAQDRVVDEPAAKGHRVTFHYRLSQDRVVFEGSPAGDTDIVLGETPVLPGFSEQLIGMKAGEEKRFPIRFPDTWSRKDLAGRSVEVELMVKKVATIDLPALDDGFVAKLGSFKTIAELRDNMRANVQLEKEDTEERRVGSAAVEALVRMSTFDAVPDIIIDAEITRIQDEIAYEVRQQGIVYEDWLKKLGKMEQDLKKELQPQAEARVKATLALRALAKSEEVIPEEKELLEEVEHVLQHAGNDPVLLERVHSHAFHEYLKNQIVTKKTVEWLKKKVVRG